MTPGIDDTTPGTRRVLPPRAVLRFWLLVLSLALVVGAFGSVLAWRFTRPIYRSEVLVRVRYHAPRLTEAGAQAPTPFAIVLESQKTLIRSKRVAELALQDPIWSGNPPKEGEEYFGERLNVDTNPDSEFLRITVADDDVRRAMLGVNSIANAYEYLYRFEEDKAEKSRLGVLESRRSGLKVKVEGLEKRLAQPSAEYGTNRLGVFYTAAAAEVIKLQSALADIDMEMAVATAVARRAEQEQGRVDAAATTSTRPTTQGQAATRSLSELDGQRRSVIDQLERTKEVLRVLANVQPLEELQAELQRVMKQIEFLRDEEMLQGRMSIVSAGQMPVEPWDDPRPVRALAWGGGGAAVVIVTSLLLRRMRSRHVPTGEWLPS
jgi:hypothetical protein